MVPRLQMLREQAASTYVFINNHYEAQAVLGARVLRELLDDATSARPPTGDGS